MGSLPGEPVWRREPSGRRVGTQAANLSQLAWASWPAGGQSQGSARGTNLARVGGALCLSPFSTPTKLGAPSMRLPHSSPQNTVHSTLPGLGDPDRSRSPSRLLCPHLSRSSSSSPGPYTPTLPHLPRRAPHSPACLGPTASSLSAQICPPPGCRPGLTSHLPPLPAHPRPLARSLRPQGSLSPLRDRISP